MMIKKGQEESVEAYVRKLDELAAKAYPNETRKQYIIINNIKVQNIWKQQS